MRIKATKKPANESCGEGKYCVQLYSRRAALVSEFCLDMQENNLSDLAVKVRGDADSSSPKQKPVL